MEYLTTNLWLVWLIITVVCLILELISFDFFLTCFSIGAFCAMIVALVGSPIWIQVLAFAVFSVLSIWLIRPRLLRSLHARGHDRKSNAEALIGREGIIIDDIKPDGSGYVKIDGDAWRAVTPGGEPIEKGEHVRIVKMESIVATVERV